MTFFTDIWRTLRTFYEARHEPENMRPLAEWYWRTLLVLALFSLGLILVYGTWEFFTVMRKLHAGSELKRSEQPVLLTRKDLTELLAAYEAREAAFEAAKRGRPSVADPSR